MKYYATKRFGKKAQLNSNTYQELCKKYLKNGTDVSMRHIGTLLVSAAIDTPYKEVCKAWL